MTGCHMVKVFQGIQMPCWSTVSHSFPSPSLAPSFPLSLVYPSVLLSLCLYSLIYLYVLYRQVMHVLS